MNLIDLYNSEVQVTQKMEELSSFIDDLATIAGLEQQRPSARMRLARMLIATGLTLAPDAMPEARSFAVASATASTD